ncbi:MAG: hypothetical protein KUG65_02960 [Sphingomonadaceae bacterium]|nr:hypothetical protein [Sphingomonadaceae bacterium]
MAIVPVYCEHCGASFHLNNFIGGTNSKSILLSGCMTQCPHCGKTANIIEGKFHLQDDQLLFVDGPPLSRAMMTRLQQVIEVSQKKSLGAEEILVEVAEVSPELAAQLREKGFAATVLVFVLILLMRGCELNITIDINELIDQATELKQAGDSDQSPDLPPPDRRVVPNVHERSTLAVKSKEISSRQVRRQEDRLDKNQNPFDPKPA